MRAGSGAGAGVEIDVEAKVAFLAQAGAYPEATGAVTVTETHFSWVFLTDRHVYKLKKPLRGDGFDFTSLVRRRRNSETEVRLNRRLARDVYVGVVPLTCAAGGQLALGGEGPAVDWLVKMVRLPADRMLDQMLAAGRRPLAGLHALGRGLAGFFAAARPVDVPAGFVQIQCRRECSASLRAFDGLPRADLLGQARQLALRLDAFVHRRSDLLAARVRARRIVEGHGDLRPEHVWLGPSLRIIDCLEFSRLLRLVDPVDELAFLSLECARLGAPEVEGILFRHYGARTGDAPPPELVAFYKTLRALIRARIAISHLKDAVVRDPPKWPRRAADYLTIGLSCSLPLVPATAGATGRRPLRPLAPGPACQALASPSPVSSP